MGKKKIAVKNASEKKPEPEPQSRHEKQMGEDGEAPEKKPVEQMTKAELKEELQEVLQTSEENYDLFLRSQADIENLKKRNAREKEEWIKYSNESLIKELLPVVDNLEKAMSHSQDENSIEALREGVELTLKGLIGTLAKVGLEEVEAKGESFDPNFHHAVSELEDENVEPGVVIEELQKGYRLRERLIRPALVVVSKG
ncbi:MAG: nucleotide exchange factor GrpE [Deltaproteobacteria bacterium]|nr:nucleotide exchange factor GrpE [Deltaproteobacteria bacterium]MBW1941284.1 nucleotide exchange factor GrpE [Deltaproteobacteria bacterium]MBW2208328.1 nucleotide exchange factor GrpE [Deltaproteobacteria bacterium]